MNAVWVRPAAPNDASDVSRIWHCSWHAGHAAALPWLVPDRPLAVFKAKAPEILSRCVVAETDRVVGFAAWRGNELGQLFMEPMCMGAGLAPLLLAAAEAALHDEGVEDATLTCVVGNARARAFYLRNGWHEQGIEDYPAQVAGGVRSVSVWRLTKRTLASSFRSSGLIENRNETGRAL